MDFQILLHAYEFMLVSSKYSHEAKKILGVMYASNHEYFTIHDLMVATNLEAESIRRALDKLIHVKELKSKPSKREEAGFEYGLRVEGIIDNLISTTRRNLNIANLVEKILDGRDESNLELNELLEKLVLLNSEVNDFAAQRMQIYFGENKSRA